VTVVVIVCAVLITAGAVPALIRLEKGPSILDRAVALDVLVAMMIAGIGVYAALHRRPDVVPVLVVLSLVGFVGSVSIARFAAVEPEGEGRVRTRDEVAVEAAAALGVLGPDAEEPEVQPRTGGEDTEHLGGGAEGEVR
jgi:multicomponent Na+:H+ antiporter subunit F